MRLIAFAIVVFSGAIVALSDNDGAGAVVMLIGGLFMLAELFVTGFFTEVKNAFNQRRPTEPAEPVERRPEV